MSKTVMGYWDCPQCKTKGIKGLDRVCPNCGRPRGDEIKFYMKNKHEYIDTTKTKVSDGPDWFCPYCQTLNSSSDLACKSCGAPREDSEKDYFDIQREREAKEAAASMSGSQPGTSPNSAAGKPFTAEAAKKKSRKRLFIILAIILGLFGLITFLGWQKSVKVEAFEWTRQVEIEKSSIEDLSGWSLPADATLQYTQREFHYYTQVIDHYETVAVERSRQVEDGGHYEYDYVDKGNGTFEENSYWVTDYRTEYYTDYEQQPVYRDEPVYDTKYYYKQKVWRHSRYVDTSGNDHDPYFGELSLAENERAGTKTEHYYILTQEKEKTKKYELDFDEWNALSVGDDAEVGLFEGDTVE